MAGPPTIRTPGLRELLTRLVVSILIRQDDDAASGGPSRKWNLPDPTPRDVSGNAPVAADPEVAHRVARYGPTPLALPAADPLRAPASPLLPSDTLSESRGDARRLGTRLGLTAVIMLAAGLYLWDLPRNGWGNEYYAAAVLSMTQSLSNFFYGSLDPGGFITVDKPPFAFWVQALAARIFGFGSWSILAPQAIAGVAVVVVVFLMVRRAFGPAASLLAALVLAVTPTAVVMNRDNLPDSMLVLLMVLAAWATLTAIITGRTWPLLVGAALVGLAFNTKMLQAYIVVPSLALAYLVAAPGSTRRRLASLAAAGLVLLVVSASWMLVVDAIPGDQRPYIGGSTNNTVLDLVVGYNGFGRILGNRFLAIGAPDGPGSGIATGPGSDPSGGRLSFGPGGGPPGFGGPPGPLRMLNADVGPHIGWLLPFSAIALVAGLLDRRGSPRTDVGRASYLLWGGWLATHLVVFSFARGIFHAYYTVAMAPAVASLCGPGLLVLWRWYRRGSFFALVLPAALVLTADTAFVLVSRTTWGEPWLRFAILGGAAISGCGLLAVHLLRWPPLCRIAPAGLAAGLAAIMVGPVLWSFTTLQSPIAGVMPHPGPGGGPGGFGGARAFPPGGPSFGPGGLAQVDNGLLAYLIANQGSARYLVATTGSMSAAPLILETGKPVMSMGGFSGSDPAPTLEQLERMVAAGELRFVLAGGPGAFAGGPGGQATDDRPDGARAPGGARIEWVRSHCQPVDPAVYGGAPSTGGAARRGESQQLYDCAGATPSSS